MDLLNWLLNVDTSLRAQSVRLSSVEFTMLDLSFQFLKWQVRIILGDSIVSDVFLEIVHFVEM